MRIAYLFTLLFIGNLISAQDTLKLFFEIDERVLNEEHKSIIAKSIKSDPDIGIKDFIINGYADFLGSDLHNEILSQDRASATSDFLLVLGLKKYQILSVKGFGKQLTMNSTLHGDPQNRRVDVIIKDPVTKDSVITFRRIQNMQLDSIDIDNLNVGDNIILENLNFQPGRHFLLAKSKPTLDILLNIMKENPNLGIEIQGHICCQNFDDFSDGEDLDTGKFNLSVARAKYIYDYLIQNSIEPERLSYKGFGSSKPLIKHEKTTDDQIKNRRVEIKITKK